MSNQNNSGAQDGTNKAADITAQVQQNIQRAKKAKTAAKRQHIIHKAAAGVGKAVKGGVSLARSFNYRAAGLGLLAGFGALACFELGTHLIHATGSKGMPFFSIDDLAQSKALYYGGVALTGIFNYKAMVGQTIMKNDTANKLRNTFYVAASGIGGAALTTAAAFTIGLPSSPFLIIPLAVIGAAVFGNMQRKALNWNVASNPHAEKSEFPDNTVKDQKATLTDPDAKPQIATIKTDAVKPAATANDAPKSPAFSTFGGGIDVTKKSGGSNPFAKKGP